MLGYGLQKLLQLNGSMPNTHHGLTLTLMAIQYLHIVVLVVYVDFVGHVILATFFYEM